MFDFKSGDIVYVGNQDNIGFSLVSYARSKGIRAWLLMVKRGINRSDPDFFKEGLFSASESFIIHGKNFLPACEYLQKCQGLHIFSTGIEVIYMLRNLSIYNNHYLIPTGSDLSSWPFVTPANSLIKNYLKYKEIFTKKMDSLRYIYTSQLDCEYAARSLGLHSKLKHWRYPSPISYMKEQRPRFICSDNIKTIFFMPARKNGDPRYASDKRPQLILNAIEKYAKQVSPDSLKQTLFLNLNQGNGGKISYSFVDFGRDLNQLQQSLDLNVLNLRSLEAKEFWSLLQDPRMAVIDQFGQFHGHMGGVGRESSIFGRPVITGCLDTADYRTRKIYGNNAPILCAFTGTAIAQHMVSFANMSTHRRSELSQTISSWACSVFNPDTAFQQILDDLYT